MLIEKFASLWFFTKPFSLTPKFKFLLIVSRNVPKGTVILRNY
jgi:hypothetical protein